MDAWPDSVGKLLPPIHDLHSRLGNSDQALLRGILDAALNRFDFVDGTTLSDQLLRLHDELPDDLKHPLRMLLNVAVGGLLPGCAPPPKGSVQHAALDAIKGFFKHLGPSEVFWKGRPPQLTSKVLTSLRLEAESLRASAVRRNRAYVSQPGPRASSIVTSEWLAGIAGRLVGGWRPSGFATFIYYSDRGDGCSAHVDVSEFALNVILCLKHDAKSSERSRLVLFPVGRPEIRLDLNPGELVLFNASSLVHGREDIGDLEEVILLTAGFSHSDSEPTCEQQS